MFMCLNSAGIKYQDCGAYTCLRISLLLGGKLICQLLLYCGQCYGLKLYSGIISIEKKK